MKISFDLWFNEWVKQDIAQNNAFYGKSCHVGVCLKKLLTQNFPFQNIDLVPMLECFNDRFF